MTGCERSWKTQRGGWGRRLAGHHHNDDDDDDDLDDDCEEEKDDGDDDDLDQVINQLIRPAEITDKIPIQISYQKSS